MTTRWARFVRGWIAAVISVFVALFSHVLAGGRLPSTVALVLCLAFAGMICIALTARSLSTVRLAISVTVSQVMFHGAFSLLGTAPMPAAVSTGSAATRAMSMTMGGHPLSESSLSASRLTAAPMADSGMSMPAWMWAAHAMAAILTIVALRYGERAFWQCIALARPFARRLMRGIPRLVQPLAPRVAATIIELLPKRLDAMLDTVRHRGPPALAAL